VIFPFGAGTHPLSMTDAHLFPVGVALQYPTEKNTEKHNNQPGKYTISCLVMAHRFLE